MSVEFGPVAADHVKPQLLERPVVADDFVPVMNSDDHHFLRSPGQEISLVAIETEPEGIVVVTDSTALTLREEQ